MLTDEQIAFIRENSKEVQKELWALAHEQAFEKTVREKDTLKLANLDPDTHAVGTWYCPDSPLGVCIYDEESAMGDDECIFCGEPDERK